MESSPFHKMLIRIMLLLVFIISTSCSNDPPPISLGTNIWPGYEPLYLARSQGLLSEEQIHLVEYTSASQVLNAFRNGIIQAAALTLDEALILSSEGLPVKIVLVMDISNGGDVILGQKGITKFEELKGKRIGVENTALGAYLLTRALQINGIDEKDVIIVPIELQQHLAFFGAKKIDAVVTFDPTRSTLLRQGAEILFDSSMIPNEIVDVLVVNEETYKKAQPLLIRLKEAWFKSIAQIEARAPEALEIINRRQNLNEVDLMSAYDGLTFPDQRLNKELLQGKSPGLIKTIELLIRTMNEKGLIKSLPSPHNLLADAGVD